MTAHETEPEQSPALPCRPCCQGDCHMCTSATCGCRGKRHISRYRQWDTER